MHCLYSDVKPHYSFKGKVYRVVVRLAMIYWSKCWAIKCKHEQKMSTWVCGQTIIDKISNECIIQKVKVVPIDKKMR